MQCAGTSPRVEQRVAFRVEQAAARFTKAAQQARQRAGNAPNISSVRSIDAESARLLTKALGSVPVTPLQRKDSLIASPRISCGDSLSAVVPVVDRCRTFELLDTLHHWPDTQPETRTELLALLHTFDFFRHFDAADAVLLAQLSERMRIHRGHPLFLQGDSDEDGVFFVLHGTLSLHFDPAGCEEQILANAEAWDDAYHGREAPSYGADLEHHFGLKVASEGAGPGSVLGENALLDDHLQSHKPLATAIATSHFVCALKLSRGQLRRHEMLTKVNSRAPRVLYHPAYPSLRMIAGSAPNARTPEELETLRQIFSSMPFFMNFHGAEGGAREALDMLLRYMVIEPELKQTEVLWFEGSSHDDRRFLLHIILAGQVVHYRKGGAVDPLQLSSIQWHDKESIASVIGKQSAEINQVGNVIGGPAELSQVAAEETLVGLEGCTFATINKQIWKQALQLITRPFLYKPQVVVTALCECSGDDRLDDITPPHSCISQVQESGGHGVISRSASGDLIPRGVLSRSSSGDLRSRHHKAVDPGFERSSIQDKLATLLRDNFRIFAQMPYRRLSMLCTNLRMIRIPSHEALCFEGSPCEGVFIMLVGMAKLYTTKDSHVGAASHPHGKRLKDNIFKSFRSNSLSMHRAICGLDPATELDMLGVFRELYCGDVIFEEEAAHDLPYSSSIVAGEHSCDLIFIDSATYQSLAMPFAPQKPDPWISVGISLENTPGQRSAEDIAKIAESIGSVPGFGHLDPKLLQDLAKHVKIRQLPPESLIVQYGEKSDTMFLLLQGTVSIHEPPRGERRRCFGNAGQSFALGICNRIGCPGEEPFGLTSMINSCENFCTIACRSSCLFYTWRHADMDADLFSRFYSACRKVIRKPAYMKQPREDRKDHQILNIVNYMKENPFFSNLDFAALSRLAVSIEIIELSKGEEVAGSLTYRGSQSLAIMNKGSVSTCSSRANVSKVKFIRYHPFRPDQSRVTTALGPNATSAKPTSRGDVSDEAAQEIAFSHMASSGTNFSGPLQAASAFSRRTSVVSSAVALGRMNKRQMFSRTSSSKSQRWSVAFAHSALLDPIEHRTSDDFELVEHLVASYGQGFWTGLITCFANEDDSEVFVVSKLEWRKILNSQSMLDVSEVSSLLNSHPCFQGLKSFEIQNFLQHSKHVQLKEGTVLFHSGDTLSDVFFLKEGSIQLRTNNIFLHRDPMSAVGKLHIPSSVVASVVDTDAIINDIINLTDDTPVEVLEKWMEHRESYTALAASKTTLVAISKVALLTLSAEKRTQLLQKKQTLDSFHLSRCRVLSNAHEGLLRGQQIVPWKHPVPKQERQQNDIISELQHKKFAHKQPPIHRPPWAKHVTETVDTHGYLKALVSPRFKGMQLPRMQNHPKPDVELSPGSNNAPRSPQSRSAAYSSTNQKTETAHKRNPESFSDPSAPAKPHTSTFGFHEFDALRSSTQRHGESAKQLYLRNGRPGNMGLSLITKSQVERWAKEKEKEQERERARESIAMERALMEADERSVEAFSSWRPKRPHRLAASRGAFSHEDGVQGFSMLEGKEYRANELLHASHSPLFPFLFLAEN